MANKNLREFLISISTNIEMGESFNIDDIPEVELPENFSDEFHKQYLTPLSAKNNKEIMGHFRGQYLSTADNRLKASFLANGGDEEMFNELKTQEPDSMKLIDLVFGKVSELKSKTKAPSDNKEFEKYKLETAKQIQLLKDKEDAHIVNLNKALTETNAEWSSKLKDSKITSYLNTKTFNNGMDKADAIYLIKRKIEDSKYLFQLDENLNGKVMSKEDPTMAAIIDGKTPTMEEILDTYSSSYTQKNEQPATPVKREVTVPSETSSGDGRFIVGHPDYGKK